MKKLSLPFLTLFIFYSCSSPDFEIPDSNQQLDVTESTNLTKKASTGDVELSEFEVMAFLPYWGFINTDESTTNSTKVVK